MDRLAPLLRNLRRCCLALVGRLVVLFPGRSQDASESRSQQTRGPERCASEPKRKAPSFDAYEADVSGHDRDVRIWMDLMGVRILASSLLCEPARHRSQTFGAAHQRALLPLLAR